MTSVIFNDPSGSDYLYKFSGVQLNAPSGETLALGANAKTADNSNAIVTVGESYIRIPQGVSNERPDISNSYIGMMRYLTTDNLLEYFNGISWLPVSSQPTDNLEDTLNAGNNAGTNDIDMNSQDILNVNDISLTTINGGVYPPAPGNLVINDQTASYTLVATDNNKRVIMDSASATTITVDDLVLDTGDSVFIANKGAGKTTITAGAGVSIGSASGLALEQFRSALLLAFSASNFSLFLSAGFSPIIATGGTVSDVVILGVSFRIHTYDVVGTFSFDVSSLGSSNGNVDYLVVAGGGGGGSSISSSNTGGGGGAGGYRSSVSGESSGGGSPAEAPLGVSVGSFTITVGDGGAAGANGDNSVFATVSCDGGGKGGNANNGNGSNGGSGGGGSGATGTGGTATSNQGFNGGTSASRIGGGGGGAGQVGQSVGGGLTTGAEGGDGISSNINGTPTPRGGGGGSGSCIGANIGGAGGSGGGGKGGDNGFDNAVSGLANTGGGGGGASDTSSNTAGSGGSGIVIIRYPI